jgi:hypothetical protein
VQTVVDNEIDLDVLSDATSKAQSAKVTLSSEIVPTK